MAYAEAVGNLGEASATLRAVTQQLGFLSKTAEARHLPWAREARKGAVRVIEYAVETARDKLGHGAQALEQTARRLSPPSDDLLRQAALSRSAIASTPIPAALSGPVPTPAAPAAPSARSLR